MIKYRDKSKKIQEVDGDLFVTKDKNGKDVFADDKIKRVPYEGDPNPKPYQTEGRTGTVAWHHGFLQWCFLDDRTHHLDDLVDSEIFEAGIELIEDKDNGKSLD